MSLWLLALLCCMTDATVYGHHVSRQQCLYGITGVLRSVSSAQAATCTGSS